MGHANHNAQAFLLRRGWPCPKLTRALKWKSTELFLLWALYRLAKDAQIEGKGEKIKNLSVLSFWYPALACRILCSVPSDLRVNSLSITEDHGILEVENNHWSLLCTIFRSKHSNCPDNFWVSQKTESALPLWLTCASDPSPSKFKRFPGVQRKPPVFQSVPIASSAAAAHCWKKPDCPFWFISSGVYIHWQDVSQACSSPPLTVISRP